MFLFLVGNLYCKRKWLKLFPNTKRNFAQGKEFLRCGTAQSGGHLEGVKLKPLLPGTGWDWSRQAKASLGLNWHNCPLKYVTAQDFPEGEKISCKPESSGAQEPLLSLQLFRVLGFFPEWKFTHEPENAALITFFSNDASFLERGKFQVWIIELSNRRSHQKAPDQLPTDQLFCLYPLSQFS